VSRLGAEGKVRLLSLVLAHFGLSLVELGLSSAGCLGSSAQVVHFSRPMLMEVQLPDRSFMEAELILRVPATL
jgi:hypothetical protein